MRLAFAIVNKTDNGYVVKYPEAVQVEHQAPSSVSALDDAQIEIMAAMQVFAREGIEDEPWAEETRQQSLDTARARLREIRDKFAIRTQKAWTIKIAEWHFPGFDGLLKAMQSADKAHEQLQQLLRTGANFVGPLQPAVLMVGGGSPMF
jgi:hypothetical protein